MRADAALVNQQGFNAELLTAVLCLVEETDLRRQKQAYGRIKDWVTSIDLLVHPKGETPYMVPNTTHWLQTANDPGACPIFQGDTRITMIHVPVLEQQELIPKRQLLWLLEKEASDFMAAVLNLEVPPSGDRLNVPVVVTEEKKIAAQGNQTMLELFLEENCHNIDGKMIKISDFYDRFKESLDAGQIHEWSKIRVGKEMVLRYPKGRRSIDGQWMWGNIAWEPRKPDEPTLPKLEVRNEMLVPTNGMVKV
jgi:hypothetical protein